MRAVGVTGHVGGVDQPRDLEVVKRSRDAELAVGLLVVPEVAVIGCKPYDTTGSWNMQHTSTEHATHSTIGGEALRPNPTRKTKRAAALQECGKAD